MLLFYDELLKFNQSHFTFSNPRELSTLQLVCRMKFVRTVGEKKDQNESLISSIIKFSFFFRFDFSVFLRRLCRVDKAASEQKSRLQSEAVKLTCWCWAIDFLPLVSLKFVYPKALNYSLHHLLSLLCRKGGNKKRLPRSSPYCCDMRRTNSDDTTRIRSEVELKILRLAWEFLLRKPSLWTENIESRG